MEEVGVEVIKRNWWAYLLRGLVAIALGIILLAWPGATLTVLIVVFGVFALIEGAIEFILAIVLASKKEPWGLTMVKSLVGLLLGGVIIARPDIALSVVVILFAIWMIATGFIQLILAFEMPPMSGRSLVGFGGILSVVIGILLLAVPWGTVHAVLILIAILALVLGLWLIILGFYSLNLKRKLAVD